MVAFSSATYQVSEAAGFATVTVNLSTPSALPVTVTFAISNGSASACSSYPPSSSTLTFNSGDTSETFTVPIPDDNIDEPDETLILTLSNPVNAKLGPPSTATLTIIDDDPPPTVAFSSATYSVSEAAGIATITVNLTNPSAFEVRVNYETSNGTATAGSDYTATSGTLIFIPCNTSEAFTVPIPDDNIDEPDETVNLALSNPVNAILGTPSTAILTIIDNDPIPTVWFSSATYSVSEAAGFATITVNLSTPSGFEVRVNYETSNGTATAGSDYTATSGTLIFNSGDTSEAFTVPIYDDNIHEPDETVNLTLSNPVNAKLGPPPTAILTIIDNDPIPTVSLSSATYSVSEAAGVATVIVNLSNPSAFEVKVNCATYDGTASAGSDYTAVLFTLTFIPGDTSETCPVPIHDDNIDEPNETVNLALSNPVNAILGTPSTAILTIIDNDPIPTVSFSSATYSVSEAAGIAIVTVNLTNPSAFEVRVNYATSDGTAKADYDYTATSGTLIFNSGDTSEVFTIPIHDDNIDEPNETVNLTLSNPVNAILGTPSTATLTIIDNDPIPTISFSSATYSVSEFAGIATVTVNLSNPSGFEVRVNYETSNGTATAGSDYTATSGTLIFNSGDISETFTVLIYDDSIDEPDETLILTLSNPVNAKLGPPPTAILTIIDDDPPPTVAFSSATYSVSEAAGFATITVNLSTPSGFEVRVNYETSNGTATAGSDYTATSGTLIFNSGNTSEAFTVLIHDDNIDEPDETVNLTLSNPVNANLGIPYASLLTIIDDREIFLPMIIK